MSKGYNSVESVKYHWRVDHLKIVQFPQILYLRDSSLIELEVILFKARGNLLEDIIDDHDDKILVVTVK